MHTPTSLNLKRDEALDITWSDGQHSLFTIQQLRANCPCASCKVHREQQQAKAAAPAGAPAKRSLTVLSGNYAAPLTATTAALVGNYALRIEWSDDHDTGIYSFTYLRELADTLP
jgi:DUF971 family protein